MCVQQYIACLKEECVRLEQAVISTLGNIIGISSSDSFSSVFPILSLCECKKYALFLCRQGNSVRYNFSQIHSSQQNCSIFDIFSLDTIFFAKMARDDPPSSAFWPGCPYAYPRFRSLAHSNRPYRECGADIVAPVWQKYRQVSGYEKRLLLGAFSRFFMKKPTRLSSFRM